MYLSRFGFPEIERPELYGECTDPIPATGLWNRAVGRIAEGGVGRLAQAKALAVAVNVVNDRAGPWMCCAVPVKDEGKIA